jgi:hypothetical protein
MPNGQSETGSSLRAMNVGIHRRPMNTFRADRTCAEPGCETRLSVYNPRQRCWLHEPAHAYHPKVGRTRNSDRVSVY